MPGPDCRAGAGSDPKARYVNPDSGTRPPVETKRGRAVHSSLDREDDDQPELTRNPRASAHRWASTVKRLAQGTAAPVLLIPLIPRAKPQGSRIFAKFTRLGNPILHRVEPVGKTLAQSHIKGPLRAVRVHATGDDRPGGVGDLPRLPGEDGRAGARAQGPAASQPEQSGAGQGYGRRGRNSSGAAGPWLRRGPCGRNQKPATWQPILRSSV